MIETHWYVFGLVVLVMLVLDLGVIHRKAHTIKVREAINISIMWIAVALAFNLGIYLFEGKHEAILFLTGYLVEKSLSVDNLFVFSVVFTYFAVPAAQQHRVLFWGILGAIIMRGIIIAAGIELIDRFFWMTYVLGAFLIFTGIKTALESEEAFEPGKNPFIKLLKKMIPVTDHYEGGKFFIRKAGKLFATPLFVVLAVIEFTDVIFALDSVPAILAITTDPFIVYSSNLFAILGLRALYFALAGVMELFEFLRYGVSLILVFVGAQMVLKGIYEIPETTLLIVIVFILTASVVASMVWGKKVVEKKQEEE